MAQEEAKAYLISECKTVAPLGQIRRSMCMLLKGPIY